ncbi:MAG: hypothetical protein H6658_16660 [Ardenticatenaceae bacterium]|nr:hypothetical protein [Ardenticatenaceae bacterium]
MNLYLLTSFLFIFVAVLGALDASSISLNLLPGFSIIRWLRVHLITLGVMTEMLFGILPILVAQYTHQPRPRTRLDIWLLLNMGMMSLLIGIPLVNQAIIVAGGTLIFLATLLLMHQLWQMRAAAPQAPRSVSRKFYLVGLAFFLLGIVVGMGFYFGWNAALGMLVPIEVHIHANNWGLMSLVFAGLLIDLYPQFTGRELAWPRSVNAIFWLMSWGALGLVLGPWTGSKWFTVPGLLMHLTATIWLLLNLIRPLRHQPHLRTPGIYHLITAYAWLLAPVLIAPLILLGVPGFPGAGIEANAPQALIYGWVLQFGYALLPYLLARLLLGKETAVLGGSWFSLTAVHLGGIFLWASIFITPIQGVLHGLAYLLWAISAVPILSQMWHITQQAWQQFESSQWGEESGRLSTGD